MRFRLRPFIATDIVSDKGDRLNVSRFFKKDDERSLIERNLYRCAVFAPLRISFYFRWGGSDIKLIAMVAASLSVENAFN